MLAERDDLTVVIAPGAGQGAPACLLPAHARIEIDGTHLGVDPATADPARPADRYRYPTAWGLFVHECAHARHTAWNPPPTPHPPPSVPRMLLEESRIEAAHTRRRPDDRHWLRAAATDLILADLTPSADHPARRPHPPADDPARQPPGTPRRGRDRDSGHHQPARSAHPCTAGGPGRPHHARRRPTGPSTPPATRTADQAGRDRARYRADRVGRRTHHHVAALMLGCWRRPGRRPWCWPAPTPESSTPSRSNRSSPPPRRARRAAAGPVATDLAGRAHRRRRRRRAHDRTGAAVVHHDRDRPRRPRPHPDPHPRRRRRPHPVPASWGPVGRAGGGGGAGVLRPREDHGRRASPARRPRPRRRHRRTGRTHARAQAAETARSVFDAPAARPVAAGGRCASAAPGGG